MRPSKPVRPSKLPSRPPVGFRSRQRSGDSGGGGPAAGQLPKPSARQHLSFKQAVASVRAGVRLRYAGGRGTKSCPR